MNEKLISVIIPVYNNSDIDKIPFDTINSELADVIIVDDGSTDNTLERCKEIEKNYHNITVYHIENSGPAKAREYGINCSKSKYVMFLDSDDFYENNAIERMAELIEKYNEPDMIRFRYKTIPSGIFQEKYFDDNEKFIKRKDFKKYVFPMYLSGYMLNAIWSNCVKREIISNIQLSDLEKKLKFGEDMIANLKLFTAINNVVFIEDVLYNYVYRESSSTHTLDYRKLINNTKDAIYIYTKLFDYLIEWDMYTLENVQIIRDRIKKETDTILDRLDLSISNID